MEEEEEEEDEVLMEMLQWGAQYTHPLLPKDRRNNSSFNWENKH